MTDPLPVSHDPLSPLPPSAPLPASLPSVPAPGSGLVVGATVEGSLVPAPILTGAELRELRKRAGLLQRDLAEALHYHQSLVSRWEHDVTPISLTVARELLRVMQDIEVERASIRALLKSAFL